MATKHTNMGRTDRALRAFVIAPVAIVAALALGATSIAGIVLFALAGIALVTSATGFCPGYVPFGIDTRSRIDREPQPGRDHASRSREKEWQR